MQYEDDTEVPEYNRYYGICKEPDCVKRKLKGLDKCLDCAWEDALPKFRDEVDALLIGTY